MLKKIMIGSAVLLVAALIAAMALLPGAVRAVVRDSDRIVSQFIRTTPVLSFPGDCAEVNVEIGGSVRVEQSPDEKIYVRVEGLFADRYNIVSAEESGEDGKILTLSLDNSDAFWDESRSYLFLRALNDGDNHATVLRVPKTVRVRTDNPWRLSLDTGVQFANADEYRDGSWRDDEAANFEAATERTARMLERYRTMIEVFETELNTAASTGLARGLDFDEIESDIDGIVDRQYERISGQIFPHRSEVYDEETLLSLLRSALTMRGQRMKERLLTEMGEYDEYQNQFSAEADRAVEAFDEIYGRYLEEIADLPETSDKELLPAGEEAVGRKPAETDSSEPEAPSEPAGPAESAEAPAPVEPAEPAEPSEPAEPAGSEESSAPTEPAE